MLTGGDAALCSSTGDHMYMITFMPYLDKPLEKNSWVCKDMVV